MNGSSDRDYAHEKLHCARLYWHRHQLRDLRDLRNASSVDASVCSRVALAYGYLITRQHMKPILLIIISAFAISSCGFIEGVHQFNEAGRASKVIKIDRPRYGDKSNLAIIRQLNQDCADTWCEGDFQFNFLTALETVNKGKGGLVEIRFTMTNTSYQRRVIAAKSGTDWDCLIDGENGTYRLLVHVTRQSIYGGMNGAIGWAEEQVKGSSAKRR